MKKIIALAILVPVFALAQSTNQNYTKSTTYKGPGATLPQTTIVYYDGLGRPIQKIDHVQSNLSTNIVTHSEYDVFGRQVKEYLPYASDSNTLEYLDSETVKTGITSYYQNTYGDTNPYSEKAIEKSPLDRVFKQAAPGNAWAMGSGHEIKMEYDTNILNEVKSFKATATWNATANLYDISIQQNGNYAPNELYKTITKDENWSVGNKNTTQEFKDKEGRVVLKRTFNGNYTHYDTYYVYDQYGNLTYVLPPATEGATSNLDGLCYQYKYDARNRLVAKKLPGKQWEFIVYNKLDLPVATGPANNPFGNGTKGWLVTKYDALNRPIYTGWLSSIPATSEGRNIMLSNYNSQPDGGLFESPGTGAVEDQAIPIHYTNNYFPKNIEILLTVTYYDDYRFSFAPSGFPISVESQDATNKVKGLITGSWARILSTPNSLEAETSYTLYDSKVRPIRVFTQNYLGGYTQVDSKLDFMGKVLYTITRHKKTNSDNEIKIIDTFEYTPEDRLYMHKQQIDQQPEQLIALNNYDALGQLTTKYVGGTALTDSGALQKVDYTYNIRGWLKSINDIQGLKAGDGFPNLDQFSFKINYNDPTTATPLYNGNISETLWRSNTDDVLRKYDYAYDDLNRLNAATFSKPEASNYVNSYGEMLDYDSNGNITNLERTGGFEDIDAIPIDKLKYIYSVTNPNQLNKVIDESGSPQGFDNGTTEDNNDYEYDADGNMIKDLNKGITSNITYNHLNLPVTIVFNNDPNTKIIYLYNALGVKVKKTVHYKERVLTIVPWGSNSPNNDPPVTFINKIDYTDYLQGGFQYLNNVMQFFPHAEGYVKINNDLYDYVFNYTDHLGNVRVSYGDIDKNGILGNEEVQTGNGANIMMDYVSPIIEENHYYPFGLKHEGYVYTEPTTNKYKFIGQEWQDELGLNVYDFDNRVYDPADGRFWQMDPLAEQGRRWSPYNYCFDNPVYFQDPDGMWPWPTWSQVKSFANEYRQGAWGTAKNIAVGAVTSTYNGVRNGINATKQVYNAYQQGGAKAAAKEYVNQVYQTSGAKNIVDTAKKAASGDPKAIGSTVTAITAFAVARQAGKGGSVASAEAGEVSSAASKANTLKANRAQGANFENQVQSQLEGSGNQVASQVTIEAADGTRTRPDFVTVNPEGTIGITEAKSSATAPLTPNQSTAFPLIEQSGGTVIGNKGNSIGLPAGTVIPPTKVNVVRPQ